MTVHEIQEAALAARTASQNAAKTTAAKESDFQRALSSSIDTGSASLDSIFEKAAATYHVDVNLLKAIAKQESNFRTDIVSKAGATGIMQLMPSTAKSLGVSDATDPEQNIMGGAKLISQLLKKYDNNTELALAAYNAGSGNVAKYNGIPPFQETQNYVRKVMGYYKQDITVPDTTVTTSRTAYGALHTAAVDSTTAPVQTKPQASLLASGNDTLFSYEDYLRFLDIYMKL